MAHKKAGGSTRNGRDSNPKYLGVKRYGGEVVKAGAIILRQRGTKYHAGSNVVLGKNHDILAKVAGRVVFARRGSKNRMFVSIIPELQTA